MLMNRVTLRGAIGGVRGLSFAPMPVHECMGPFSLHCIRSVRPKRVGPLEP